MDKFVDYIIFLGGFLIFLGFLKIFRGIYIGYLIDQGTFRDKELDEFPLPCINKDDYENIVEKIATFVSQLDNNIECCLTLNNNDINCLVCNGLTPVKPYHIKSENGLLFYYFELNRLFKQEMSYAGPDGVYYGINEILLSRKIPYATSDRVFTETEIFVREDFVYPDPPANKLEEWFREKESKLIRGAFIYRSLFIRSLFNSDLNLSEEEIIAALKKVTSLEIVNNQLIFQANGESREVL
jgi:hypothetical protein